MVGELRGVGAPYDGKAQRSVSRRLMMGELDGVEAEIPIEE